ncbi:MAG: glycosyltransferase family 2 protein [Acidobacteria bacterium]|nr:glycosyltransferase family 2 protein [Acidobacteriota bacterium]
MKPNPFIIAIILNNNRREDTLSCLDSLKKNLYPNISIILLDNNSSDGSVETIAAAHPDVEIIPLKQNLGYAGNNNVGIGLAIEKKAEWVIVLNEDTILAPDCLNKLIEAGETDPRIGIVGPMVYHHDEPNVIQSAGGKLSRHWESLHLGQNEYDGGQYMQLHDVDWISGCALMVRRAVIEQVGKMDERYFCYWEETEWCIRAAKSEWRIVHVPQAKLWHKGVLRDYQPAPHVTYYSARNRLLTLSKHQAPLFVRLSVYGEILRTLTSWTVRPKWRMMRVHREALWQAVVDFVFRRWGQWSKTMHMNS